MVGCRCGWLLTYTAALSKDSRHHAASTSTGFASDFRRTRRHPNQPRNFSALRRYVGRIRFFIHSRSQPNNYYSSCRFRTAHRKAPCSGLTLPWCRNAVAYIWCGIAVLPCFCASGKVPVTRCGLPLLGTYAAYLVGFPLRLSHAHARLRPRKHLKRRRSVMARRTHPHAQFSASIVISMSGTPIRSDIVRALPGLWCRRLDSNQRRESAPGTLRALPTELRLHEGGARLSEPPDLFRASLLPADHRRNYCIEA